MPTPLRRLPNDPAAESYVPHEINLEGWYAGSYVKVGGHWFIVEECRPLFRLSRLPAHPHDDAVRDMTNLEVKLVHADWKGCDE
jgi:hypothetical protein